MNIPFGNLRAMLWGKWHFSGDLKNEKKISIPGRVFQAGETLGIKGKEVRNALNSWKKKMTGDLYTQNAGYLEG